MYDYESAMKSFFRNFFTQEEKFLFITFTLKDTINDYDTLSRLYADKFDQQFLLKGYVFAPPDIDSDKAIKRSGLISFYEDRMDKARVNTYLAKYDSIFPNCPALQTLLNISLFKI